MFNLNNLKMSDIIRCGIAVRKMGSNASNMEEAATELVNYIYNDFGDENSDRAFALVRLFKTHDIDKLPENIKEFAYKLLTEENIPASFKCLTLLGTRGIEEEWNDRTKSKGHQAIPLPSKEVLNRIPMMRNLVKQMGLNVETVIKPDPDLLTDLSQKTFNVFYVPKAEGSPYIPAQEGFVIPYKIKSVLGFGGILPSGNVFTIIAFSKTAISHDTANLFNTLALNVKMLIMPFENAVFTTE